MLGRPRSELVGIEEKGNKEGIGCGMKAIYITKHGSADVLTYGELPDPVIGSSDVLIRVRACALNRLDLITRTGVRGTKLRLDNPHILGGDVSGDILEVGAQVNWLKSGDRVVVNPKLPCSRCQNCVVNKPELCTKPGMVGSVINGGYAEYISVPATNVVLIPNSISYEEAASLPTVFLPCWNILLKRANLKPWETVLILSASSGVGTAAIQVAKNVIGARVIATTSSTKKEQKALSLGVDHVINYTRDNILETINKLTDSRGVDVVVDHVGSEFWPAAMSSLAPGGRYGICGVTTGYRAELQMGALFVKQQTVMGVFMGSNQDLQRIVDMVDRRKLKGVIHRIFELADAVKAHETMESRDFFGKLILKIP